MSQDHRYWEVRLIVAIPSDHDVSGIDVCLEALRYDVETIVLESIEKELVFIEKGDAK